LATAEEVSDLAESQYRAHRIEDGAHRHVE
jgi:hypothetical protein